MNSKENPAQAPAKDGTPSRRTPARAAVLALASIVCAFSSATASLVGLQLSLPPSDGAYGQPLTAIWSDPFVSMAVFGFMWPAAAIGYLLALALLWRTKLSVSIPVVFVITVALSGVFGHWGPFAAPMALGAAVLAMVLCRLFFSGREALPR